jgi:hypothetical protein
MASTSIAIDLTSSPDESSWRRVRQRSSPVKREPSGAPPRTPAAGTVAGSVIVLDLTCDSDPGAPIGRGEGFSPNVSAPASHVPAGGAAVAPAAASSGPSGASDDSGSSLFIDLSVDDSGIDAPAGPAVIDLDEDDAIIARSLQASLHQASNMDLASMQAARERRRQARREHARMMADAVDLEAEPEDLLVEQRASISELIKQAAPKCQIPGAPPRFGRSLQLEVWLNPRSLPGCSLYERFVAAWGQVPDKTIRLVFHGTPEANINCICRDGLDPRRRNGQVHGSGEYFGGNMDVSLGYCRGGRYMLVFAVLLDRSGVTKVVNPQAGVPGEIVVINKPEHQLPLAVVSIGCQRWVPPADFMTAPERLHSSADIPPPRNPYDAYAAIAGLAAHLAASMRKPVVRSAPPRAKAKKSRKRAR